MLGGLDLGRSPAGSFLLRLSGMGAAASAVLVSLGCSAEER